MVNDLEGKNSTKMSELSILARGKNFCHISGF